MEYITIVPSHFKLFLKQDIKDTGTFFTGDEKEAWIEGIFF